MKQKDRHSIKTMQIYSAHLISPSAPDGPAGSSIHFQTDLENLPFFLR
jgi:hypothetical protein